MPFARALSIASATACSTTSIPHSSPARAARDRPDGADAAVEVVRRAPSPRARRTRPRRRRAARPSRCSSGRTPPARSRSAARATSSWMRSSPEQEHRAPAARGLADAVGPRPQQAVARHGLDEAVDVDLARAGHEAHADLPGPAPLADDEVAQQPGVRAAVERLEPLRARPGEHGLARLVAALGCEQAVVETPTISSHDPGAWKPQIELAGRDRCRRSTRACCGSATARRRGRGRRTRSPRGGRCASARRRPARCLISIWRS